MADTTNDIWNDNDGEEDEAPRKGRTAAPLWDLLSGAGGGAGRGARGRVPGRHRLDALRRLCSYGSGEESTAEAQYDYDASDSNRFAVLGDSLVVLSDTKLQVLARAERRSGPHPGG